MFQTLQKKNIPNIRENIIEEAINKAIQNKAIENKEELIPELGMSHKDLEYILISCPICNYSFYLEKACGVTRCCNSKNKLTIQELCNKISMDQLQHCSKKECDK